MKLKNNKFYTVKYQGKYVTNYAWREPSNPNKWVLLDVAQEEAERWFSFLGKDVKDIFLLANVELEITEISYDV